MTKIKTFTTPLRVFHAVSELAALDDEVNRFVQENNVDKVISVSDTCTTDATGATIGIIRVVAYKEAKSKYKS